MTAKWELHADFVAAVRAVYPMRWHYHDTAVRHRQQTVLEFINVIHGAIHHAKQPYVCGVRDLRRWTMLAEAIGYTGPIVGPEVTHD